MAESSDHSSSSCALIVKKKKRELGDMHDCFFLEGSFLCTLLEIEYGTELNVGTVLQYVYVQVLTIFIVFREWSARGGVGEGWC